MLRKTDICAILLMTILLSTTACSTIPKTTAREHPMIAQQLKLIDKVVIPPPMVSIENIVFTGENERMKDLEKRISDQLLIIAKNRLEYQGYEIIDFDFESACADNPDLSFAIKQVRDGFDNAKKTLYKETSIPETDKRKCQASVGTAANIVSALSGADAVVLIHFMGFKKSGGVVTKDVVVSVLVGALTGSYVQSPTEGEYIEVAVIDGATGDVIWSDLRADNKLTSDIIKTAMISLPPDMDPPQAAASEQEITTPVNSEPVTEQTTVSEDADSIEETNQ